MNRDSLTAPFKGWYRNPRKAIEHYFDQGSEKSACGKQKMFFKLDFTLEGWEAIHCSECKAKAVRKKRGK